MKQWGVFAITFVFLLAVLVKIQKDRIAAPVGPDAVLSLIADSEHELTRLPVAFTRMSDLEEIKIGNRLANEYNRQFAMEAGGESAKNDPTTRAVQAYVNRVGARVALGAQRKLPYRFHYVVDPNFINAFALPGGHVFIGGGLMALMDSEDELASVLGHEVEHIDHYHCAERLQTEAALQKLPLGELFFIPVEVFEQGYGKTQELEADREGTRLAVKARYSPLGTIRMFQTFDGLSQERARRAQSPEEELSTLALGTLEGYFRSHPPDSVRIAQIQGMISSEHWESKVSEQPLEVEYVYMTQKAARALTARNYAAAEAAATRSLSLHADQPHALAILAQAQFALMEFPAGLASYHQLLKDAPWEAAAVGDFANKIATDTLKANQFSAAAKLASGSLDIQPNNAQALIILAEAQMGMGDYDASDVTYQRLVRFYPDDSRNVIIYAASTAKRSLYAHRYKQALDVAGFWLTLQPNDREAIDIEAGAALALGNFSSAAQAYRKLLDLTPIYAKVDVRQVFGYADALSAANLGGDAPREFRTFMVADRGVSTTMIKSQIRIEYAGLALLTGNPAPATALVRNEERIRARATPPEIMGRLGWWYYRAGYYSEAEALLRHLAQERPGDAGIQDNLAWIELELNQAPIAIQGFMGNPAQRFVLTLGRPEYSSAQWNTPQMGLAIALWRAHRADEALKNYELASNAEPRWTNPLLVRTFYSTHVAQSVSELQAEHAKRLEARNHPVQARKVELTNQTEPPGILP